MKGFVRDNQLLSLCGLNCGLCSMKLGGHCSGCGNGNQSCKIAGCSLEHGGVSYCFQCPEYPCDQYLHIDDYDSFITHQNRLADMEKARTAGLEAYRAGLAERREILEFLLEKCNDGRRKTLFYLAAGLLPSEALREIRRAAEALADRPLQERGAKTAALLQAAAERKGVLLKLRKKPR